MENVGKTCTLTSKAIKSMVTVDKIFRHFKGEPFEIIATQANPTVPGIWYRLRYIGKNKEFGKDTVIFACADEIKITEA